MIINNAELYSDELNELWPHGMHKLMLYQGRAEDAVRLAKLLCERKKEVHVIQIKKMHLSARWNSSKNLEKPK